MADRELNERDANLVQWVSVHVEGTRRLAQLSRRQ